MDCGRIPSHTRWSSALLETRQSHSQTVTETQSDSQTHGPWDQRPRKIKLETLKHYLRHVAISALISLFFFFLAKYRSEIYACIKPAPISSTDINPLKKEEEEALANEVSTLQRKRELEKGK